jgi:hypothetical protein
MVRIKLMMVGALRVQLLLLLHDLVIHQSSVLSRHLQVWR